VFFLDPRPAARDHPAIALAVGVRISPGTGYLSIASN
jgi:hypothetical protein